MDNIRYILLVFAACAVMVITVALVLDNVMALIRWVRIKRKKDKLN